MEPDKLVQKYAECVRKDGKVVGRLKKRLMGRYAKTIFYFLRGDPFSKCTAKCFGPRCNLGDGEGRRYHVNCTSLTRRNTWMY